MNIIRSIAIASAVCTFFVVACSDDSSSSAASSCAEAKKVADSCNAQQNPDSGTKVTITFDQAKCESAGDQGKKAADCIVANRTKCDCFVSCQLNGSCQ